MVAHQHVGMDGDPVLVRILLEHGQQRLAVGVAGKYRLPIVPPLDDVVGIAGDGQSREAGHDESPEWTPS